MPHNAQEIRQRRTPEATDGKGGSHQAINPSLVGRGLGFHELRLRNIVMVGSTKLSALATFAFCIPAGTMTMAVPRGIRFL